MITVLMTIWFIGGSITLDMERMYDIHSLQKCQQAQAEMMKIYNGTGAFCFKGDILQSQWMGASLWIRKLERYKN